MPPKKKNKPNKSKSAATVTETIAPHEIKANDAVINAGKGYKSTMTHSTALYTERLNEAAHDYNRFGETMSYQDCSEARNAKANEVAKGLRFLRKRKDGQLEVVGDVTKAVKAKISDRAAVIRKKAERAEDLKNSVKLKDRPENSILVRPATIDCKDAELSKIFKTAATKFGALTEKMESQKHSDQYNSYNDERKEIAEVGHIYINSHSLSLHLSSH